MLTFTTFGRCSNSETLANVFQRLPDTGLQDHRLQPSSLESSAREVTQHKKN